MTTHILIELDHSAFEVTRESIENLPDWVEFGAIQTPHIPTSDWLVSLKLKGAWGDYLVAHSGVIEVKPPAWAAKYLKQNPYEACAKACEDQIKIFLSPEYATNQPLSSIQERFAAAQCAQAIRQLEQKEIGK